MSMMKSASGRPSVINDDLVVKVFDYPPYSPDLAPSDYRLFMHLKQWLGSQSFEDDDRLKTGITTWFKSLAADFYDTGVVSGDCVEK
jgi:histone-lysine N-methyltransferase SETMAR